MADQLPVVLATGFPPFPGAPVNPTQWLMSELNANLPFDGCDLRTVILPVDYATAAKVLDDLAREHRPDIIINFGLAAESSGIRLERIARNEIAPKRPDNTGRVPPSATICEGAQQYTSGLPLDAIATALQAEGLPVQWSQDAGGYLCNYVFYAGRAGLCPHINTQMTGFIHVPLLNNESTRSDDGRVEITQNDLLTAAKIIIAQCIAAYNQDH